MINDNGSILLVEDDTALATSICEYLTNEGFSMHSEANGANAIDSIIRLQPDLVILDIMLPGKDGITICREVRPLYQGIIVMFTAKEDEIDQIVGLEVGADDYLVKPVKPRLLLAKLKSLLRRKDHHGAKAEPQQQLEFGRMTLDLVARTAVLAGESLSLTAAEFDLLSLLSSRAGEILSRDDIAKQLSGIHYDGLERTIDNRISALRKKLGDDARAPSKIKTVRAQGYVLVPSAFD